MKRILFALLFLFSFHGKSQTYQPIGFDTSCYWVLSFGVYDGSFGGFTISGEYVATVVGDTMISSQQYSKIFVYPIQITVRNYPFHYPATHVYLREDTALKKIYKYDLSSGLESGYLDFDLSVGDTLFKANSFGSILADTIFIDNFLGVSRKVQQGHGLGPTIYSTIEGVGATHNFPAVGGYGEWGIPHFTTKCFSKGGITYYLNPQMASDCIKKPYDPTLSTKEIEQHKFDVIWSNNQLKIQNPKSDNYDITIYGLSGRSIISEKSLNSNRSINLNNQPKGLYILYIRSKDSYLSKKIIVE